MELFIFSPANDTSVTGNAVVEEDIEKGEKLVMLFLLKVNGPEPDVAPKFPGSHFSFVK